MTKILTHSRAIAPKGASLLTRVANFLSLSRQRRKLAQLDDAALHDLGIERSDALSESRRPAWDAPAHWRR
ncbi:MAG: DUF1127 domain-containing protein [Rhodobacteraceae bacterium]|nr:DUF1127 domain-containing protein [Paracoccaceae bacterium]